MTEPTQDPVIEGEPVPTKRNDLHEHFVGAHASDSARKDHQTHFDNYEECKAVEIHFAKLSSNPDEIRMRELIQELKPNIKLKREQHYWHDLLYSKAQ
eukprot:6214208-Amphidinium_carterae.1